MAEMLEAAENCGDHGPRDWTYGSSFPNRKSTRRALLDGQTSQPVLEHLDKVRSSIELAMAASDLTGLSARRRRVWSDQDGEIDVDRMLAERDDCWRESRRGKKTRTIRLGINPCLSCGNDEKQFAELAGTLCAVSDQIARLGYGCEILMVASVTGYRSYRPYLDTLTLKHASEPLDLHRVGAVGLPGLVRWAIYGRWFEHSGKLDSMGQCSVSPKFLKDHADIDYVFTQAWRGMDQLRILQGVTQILTEVAA